MRDDSSVEVLFPPGSSLPEISRCEKRLAKKERPYFFVCPIFPSLDPFFYLTFLIPKRGQMMEKGPNNDICGHF